MPEHDQKQQVLRAIRAAKKRLDAEQRRHDAEIEPLKSELRELLERAASLGLRDLKGSRSDSDEQQQVVREINGVRDRIDAQHRRRHEATTPLQLELRDRLAELSGLGAGARDVAKALGLNPKLAKRLPYAPESKY